MKLRKRDLDTEVPISVKHLTQTSAKDTRRMCELPFVGGIESRGSSHSCSSVHLVAKDIIMCDLF